MKRKTRDSGGGANWMDTYGDMVTLLLCFFVLLYSMSTISEDKWRSIVMSFNPDAAKTATENSGNDGPIADPAEEGEGLDEGLSEEETEAQLQSLYEAMLEYQETEGLTDSMSVTKGDGRVFISFNQAVFFAGDSAVLLPTAYPILDHVSELFSNISEAIGEVRIVGHTAQKYLDEPNDVAVDRKLSSDRATNVVIYVQQHSTVSPARLVSESIGQWRPIGDNETEEGRALNRSVEMIISGRNLEEVIGDNIMSYEKP